MTVTKEQLTKFFKAYNKSHLWPRHNPQEFSFYVGLQKHSLYPRFHIMIKPKGNGLFRFHVHIDWYQHSNSSTHHPKITELLERVKTYAN